LLRRIPITNAARVMSERRFMGLLAQALGRLLVALQVDTTEEAVASSPPTSPAGKSSTKKRKRSTENLASKLDTEEAYALAEAIYESVHYMLQLSQSNTDRQSGKEGNFASELVTAVIRTSTEEAATILGSFLAICSGLASRNKSTAAQLPAYIYIWSAKHDSETASSTFAKHALGPSLAYLQTPSLPAETKNFLEQLVCRSILLPVRKAHEKPDRLREFILQSSGFKPEYAATVFDIAVRSLQPHSAHRSKAQDNAWLQGVFTALRESLPAEGSGRADAVEAMLEICAERRISLGAEILRDVAFKEAFGGLTLGNEKSDEHYLDNLQTVNSKILATVVNLDAQVILETPEGSPDLMREFLRHTTVFGIKDKEWPARSGVYVDEILIPLVDAMAKSRKLSSYLRIWYEQLCMFERIRAKVQSDNGPVLPGTPSNDADPVKTFSAWEDESLIKKVAGLLEQILSSEELAETVTWLEAEADNCYPAVLVLIETLCRGVKKRKNAEALGLRLCKLSLKKSSVDKTRDAVPIRYRFRRYIAMASVVNLAHIYEELSGAIAQTMAENGLAVRSVFDGTSITSADKPPLEAIAAFECLAAAYISGPRGFLWDENFLTIQLQARFFDAMQSAEEFWAAGEDLGDEIWGQRLSSINPGAGWIACAVLEIAFTKYPAVLTTIMDEDNTYGDFSPVIELASATTPFIPTHGHYRSKWLQNNYAVMPAMWQKLLSNTDILENESVMSSLIDHLLKFAFHDDNRIDRNPSCNGFVVQCFNWIPTECISRDVREKILNLWPLTAAPPSIGDPNVMSWRMSPVDPALMSLRMKVAEKTLISGSVELFTKLADAISTYSAESKSSLDAFVVSVQRTLR
jgi:nucleolar pre-ribosomal-associated protein 2